MIAIKAPGEDAGKLLWGAECPMETGVVAILTLL